MAIMPQGPKQRNALIAIIAAAALFYIFWQYLYTPGVADLDETRARLERLETSNRNAQITAARGGQNLEEQTALYERHVRALEELVPASEEVPRLIRDLTALTRTFDVEMNAINPEPQQPGEFYTKEIYALRVLGDYHNVGRFLTAVASMRRIITPVEMQIELLPMNENTALLGFEAPIVADFRIETYVLPASSDPEASMGEGTPAETVEG
jgi:type IV pilus assembly protein PilO